ncbi:hypothetical protein [Advenella sp. EE-W14]|nr:hypothetical protein [Advenella sp. EE-W14]
MSDKTKGGAQPNQLPKAPDRVEKAHYYKTPAPKPVTPPATTGGQKK